AEATLRRTPDLTDLAHAPAVRQRVGADRAGVTAPHRERDEGLAAFDALRALVDDQRRCFETEDLAVGGAPTSLSPPSVALDPLRIHRVEQYRVRPVWNGPHGPPIAHSRRGVHRETRPPAVQCAVGVQSAGEIGPRGDSLELQS